LTASGRPTASIRVLVEIRFLLNEEDHRKALLTRNDELLGLIDRCLERREAGLDVPSQREMAVQGLGRRVRPRTV
jgi:hypothetical protein